MSKFVELHWLYKQNHQVERYFNLVCQGYRGPNDSDVPQMQSLLS